MQVNLQYAEEHFADLVSAADSGQDVEISRPDKPALKLIVSPAAASAKHAPRKFGAWEGLITLPTDEEWAAMDKEIEDEMVNGRDFPPDAA